MLPAQSHIRLVTTAEELTGDRGTVATRVHSVIQAWAAARRAEPATGEATASGGPSVSVNDGGAGIRFNFPGFGRFRPITWAEWFTNFDTHALTFVFDDHPADDPAPNARYRLVKSSEWEGVIVRSPGLLRAR